MTAPVKIQHNFLKCEDDATFDTFLVTSHVPLGEDRSSRYYIWDRATSFTGPMFQNHLQRKTTSRCVMPIEDFMTLLGRYFQIRDDYQNLVSGDYRTQKGLCEDLDEGKYSLPVIHALKQLDPVLQGLLQYRKQCGGMTTEMKYLAMDHLGERGSLLYTEKVLRCLEKALASHLAKLDDAAGLKNSGLAKILLKLQLG
ncbi:hypothetical protein N8I77_013265 [Diaporthe amygdali]|uniref:Uncharacterized protein n=1 Tax=Phomopsis amygdali TaxID=1214568 RepID=A0AAD9S2E0_PHOAM|nr:hypothetical protein N8I77_013265 [Diaporthe amygdali]